VRTIRLALAGTAAFVAAIASSAAAQMMVDIPIWSNGMLGQQAMRSAFDNYDEVHGIDDADERPQATSEACSADALPAAERRRMEADYVRRVGKDGKASADAWVREQGMRFRKQLIAEGVCADPSMPAD